MKKALNRVQGSGCDRGIKRAGDIIPVAGTLQSVKCDDIQTGIRIHSKSLICICREKSEDVKELKQCYSKIGKLEVKLNLILIQPWRHSA